jgi:NAD(P)-dependent dehydrogenase (short-subunit alcohol dehydrogenase family)
MTTTIFVTGADKGLGLALVKKALHAGFTTFAGIYQPAAHLQDLAPSSAGQLHLIPQDVTDLESVRRSAQHVSAITGSLDMLINNAGVYIRRAESPLPELDLGDGHLETMVEVNAFGPLRVTQQFLPLLEKGQRKTIVNVSSEAGSIGDCWRENTFGYCMSKAALNMETMLLWRYLQPRGFTVFAVHPGWMRTDMGGSDADIEADVSAAGIFTLALKSWQEGEPIYVDYTGKRLSW